MSLRHRLLAFAAFLATAAIVAAIVWRGLHEPADTNSFTLLADAFLNGRFDFKGCYDFECVRSGGKTYLIQPPFPAVLSMPLVAAFGLHVHFYIFYAAALTVLTLLVWWLIFRRLGTEPATAGWLLVAIFASTPLAYSVVRSDGVWLFAHVVGFLMASLAVHEALAGRVVMAGLALGCAFLSRQMTLFMFPFVFAIALTVQARLLPPSRETIVKGLKMGLAFSLAVGFYLFYNWSRFGLPMETGHNILAAQAATSPDITPLVYRLRDIGVFSKDYVIFNFFYMFLQGFHAQFTGPTMLKLEGLDPFGASFLAASPFLLFLFFCPRDRTIWFGALAVLPVVLWLLFYHSNGFKQYNGIRYMLDFLPVLMVFLARAVRPELRPAFGLLVTWGVLLNLATIGVLAVTRG